MNKGIIGRKLGMSQIFADNGQVIPVTVVEAGPCAITQIKTAAKEGYDSLQLGFADAKQNRDGEYGGVSKAIAGHCKKAGVSAKRYYHEFRLDKIDGYAVGGTVSCDSFAVGDIVDVTGKTKGRGFTGCIKRWNQQRIGSMTHGTGPIHRAPGSMSSNTDPARVFKNKHMPGHYGNEKVTVKNLEVVRIDAARNLLFIKGGVPGANGSLLIVKA
jgi:large subunit ribosomal protein L3